MLKVSPQRRSGPLVWPHARLPRHTPLVERAPPREPHTGALVAAAKAKGVEGRGPMGGWAGQKVGLGHRAFFFMGKNRFRGGGAFNSMRQQTIPPTRRLSGGGDSTVALQVFGVVSLDVFL